jgi:hypothetical protein
LWFLGQARDNRIPRAVCDAAVDDMLTLCNLPGERVVKEREIRAMLEWNYKRAPREPFRWVAKLLETESKGAAS